MLKAQTPSVPSLGSTAFLVAHVLGLAATVAALVYAFGPYGGSPGAVASIEWAILSIVAMDLVLSVAHHGWRKALCCGNSTGCRISCTAYNDLHCLANFGSVVFGVASVVCLILPDARMGGEQEDTRITGVLLSVRSCFYGAFLVLEARNVVSMRGGWHKTLGVGKAEHYDDWDVKGGDSVSEWSDGSDT